jgi:hypothetical protein
MCSRRASSSTTSFSRWEFFHFDIKFTSSSTFRSALQNRNDLDTTSHLLLESHTYTPIDPLSLAYSLSLNEAGWESTIPGSSCCSEVVWSSPASKLDVNRSIVWTIGKKTESHCSCSFNEWQSHCTESSSTGFEGEIDRTHISTMIPF